MTQKKPPIVWVFILSLLLLCLTFVDFLALADIHQDYVSTSILESEQVVLEKPLPEWTSATLEWSFLKLSLFVRSVAILIILISFLKLAKRFEL